MLIEQDFSFYAKKTGLTKERVRLLLEEPHDRDHLTEVLTLKRPATPAELKGVSPELKTRLFLFKYLEKFEAKLPEKSEVVEWITENYQYVAKDLRPIPNNKETGKFLSYGFTMLAFKKLSKKEREKYVSAVELVLTNMKKTDIAIKFNRWMNILGKVDRKSLEKCLVKEA